MKKRTSTIVSLILLVSLMFTMLVPVHAADIEEEYLAEVRLVYADDYEEAQQILSESEFSNYKLLNANLNRDTDEVGVWLAYKSSTNIDDAITDLAIMQMNGGYNEGNYQAMIKKSYDGYAKLGLTYLDAIEYFATALDEGDFLAELAYRQLNLYTVETQKDIGLKIPVFEGELLGDIFYEKMVTQYDLATMFLEANSYALKNIRSLLSMGVAYNEDGKTYLEKVGDAALAYTEDDSVFDDEDYDTIAEAIKLALPSIKAELEELSCYEDDFDFTDEVYTDEEIYYLEVKAIADTMREIEYLDDITLYDFFIEYEDDDDADLTALYPLCAALNDGQVAMTLVSHYYDVVRYSCVLVDEEAIEEELVALEQEYEGNPFNIYNGVDRSVYQGTFALTTEADRADAYSEIDMMNELLHAEYSDALEFSIGCGTIGFAMLALSAVSRHFDKVDHKAVLDSFNKKVAAATDKFKDGTNSLYPVNPEVASYLPKEINSNSAVVDSLYHAINGKAPDATMTFTEKFRYVSDYHSSNGSAFGSNYDAWFNKLNTDMIKAETSVTKVSASAPVSFATGLFFVVGGALTLYSAYTLISSVYNYYHPDYEDIPIAMVDLVRTQDGDRYIKYDVVYNAETNDDGIYEAGDLNAFAAKNWNALYYTKSYEAGKPLLANSFSVSNTNNKPRTNYDPVNRFGETVCYDLNKYNFEGDTHIYLSVKRSNKDKSAIADIPELVGSIFSDGVIIVSGAVGVLLGVGGTIGTQLIYKKKKAGIAGAEENDTDEPETPSPESNESAES